MRIRHTFKKMNSFYAEKVLKVLKEPDNSTDLNAIENFSVSRIFAEIPYVVRDF